MQWRQKTITMRYVYIPGREALQRERKREEEIVGDEEFRFAISSCRALLLSQQQQKQRQDRERERKKSRANSQKEKAVECLYESHLF